MSTHASWTITCPSCGHVGDDTEDSFNLSLNDEATCPKCGEGFEVDTSNRDEDEVEDWE